jgi:hypothetical protein
MLKHTPKLKIRTEIPMSEPYNNWLRHLRPEFPESYHEKPWIEGISLQLEIFITSFANQLQHQFPQMTPESCRRVAINAMTDRMLSIQREYAPDHYVEMISLLHLWEPSLEEYRQAYKRVAVDQYHRKFFNNSFLNGWIYCSGFMSVCILLGWLLAKL